MREAYKPVVIEGVYPELDCGRYPVKREVGDAVEVRADILKEGHDQLRAVVKHREKGRRRKWAESPLELLNPGLDRWGGAFEVTENALYEYAVEAWFDEFETWRSETGKKVDDGQFVELELIEGNEIVAKAAERSGDAALANATREFEAGSYEERLGLLFSKNVRVLMAEYPDRSSSTVYGPLEMVVDRVRARYAAWYEMFPRSQGTVPGRSATFREAEARLPEISSMGFDVVYLTPIHPIGETNRKGRNNALVAGPEDPGSPYGIGSEDGGHMAVHPGLGTLEDFRHFVRAAGEHGMEVALDLAVQASPDHPWVREHPEWFKFRPDGTIKYAENPPKKYQDIVNVDFYSDDREGLWNELRDVILFWVEQGVTTFRVDNPHTKPLRFWEWVIREVQHDHPQVVFLAEAFTRPRIMQALAKLGFTQSYTYFTWRNEKAELTEYLTELTQDEPKEYMRPNFFANTHDILPHILQFGGRPAFQLRLVLAATLSSVYGIYSGYELCENTPRGERGTTVYYADSEVYEYKVWDWDRPGNIKEYVARINEIRRENPALHELTNLKFHEASSPHVLFYSKTSGENTVYVAVNLDPHEAHEATLYYPPGTVGEDEAYGVEELILQNEWEERGPFRRVRLDPGLNPAEIFRLKTSRTED